MAKQSLRKGKIDGSNPSTGSRMKRRYSRLSRTEERRNNRKAFIFFVLTIASILLVFFLGLPLLAKFAAFLTDIRQSSQPIEISDTTPPVLPRFEPLPEATNEIKVEITGHTEPGATAILYLNNKTEEVLADNKGEFNYTFFLNDGNNRISAVAKDGSGNESQKTETYKILFDDEPPEIQINSPEAGSEYFGAKQRQVVIDGKTEEGAKININDRLVVVDSDGSFTFATTLSEGENSFTIKAEDKAGNIKEEGLTLHFSP